MTVVRGPRASVPVVPGSVLALSGPPARWRPGVGWPDVVLGVAVAAQVLLLLVLPQVVTSDGPAHVDGAWVLWHLGDHGAERLRSLYLVSWVPVPNSLTTWLLAAFMAVLSPDAAEKALLAGYLVALPLALRYALRGVHPAAGWAAVFAVPLSTGYLYAYGFYDFCLGLVFALLVVGWALRRVAGWTVRGAVGLAVLLLLTWYCHLLPLLVAGLFVAVQAASQVLAAHRRGQGWWAAAGRHLLPPGLAGLPVLALTAEFAVRTRGERGAAVYKPWWDLLLGLVTLGRPLVVYAPLEYVPAAVVAVALALLVWRRPGGRRPALGLTAGLVTCWYALSPDRYGAAFGFLNDRVAVLVPLLVLLWVAGPPPRTWLRVAVPAAVVAAAGALVVLRLPTELRYQRDVGEYLSVAPSIPRGSTLLALRYWRDPPAGPEVRNAARDPLRHESSRLAVRVGGVDVGHYEAALSYFPVRFRAQTDPRQRIDPSGSGLDQVPPVVDVAAAPVDAVVVVGRDRAEPALLRSPAARATLDVVERDYRRVAVSRTGLIEVWLRR